MSSEDSRKARTVLKVPGFGYGSFLFFEHRIQHATRVIGLLWQVMEAGSRLGASSGWLFDGLSNRLSLRTSFARAAKRLRSRARS